MMVKMIGPNETFQEKPSEYASVIIEHLASRIASGKPFGLLEAHGPTGIGKTHAFISEGGIIEFLHANGIPVMFCCDRWSLLDEVAAKIAKNPNLKPVTVRSNAWHTEKAYQMYYEKGGLTEKEKEAFADLIACYSKAPKDKNTVRKDIEGKLMAAHREFERERRMKAEGLTDKEKTSRANELIGFLTFEKGRSLEDKDKAAVIKGLGRNTFYSTIFPACHWFLDPFGTVLVTTTHKLVMGLDIGPLSISLTNLLRAEASSMPFLNVKKGMKTAVILDEFEAQHGAMLDAISRQVYIKDPISFQAVLYGKAKDEWSRRPGLMQGKAIEFLGDHPNGIPSNLTAGNGWDSDSSAYSFRSGNVIRTSGALSVEKMAGEYLVHKGHKVKGSTSLSEVLGDISHRNLFWLRCAEDFLNDGNPEATIYLGDAFNRLSGEPRTSHGEAISSPDNILSVHAINRQVSIKINEEMTRATANLSGYDITGLSRRSTGGLFGNPDLDIRHYAMNITPEWLLTSMATSRFVFGLSATSCLPRICNHFDMGWLKESLATRDALIVEDKLSFHARIGDLISKKTSEFSCHFEIIQGRNALQMNNWDGFFEDDDGHSQTHPRYRFAVIWDMITSVSQRGWGIPHPTSYLTFTASYRHIERVLKVHEAFQDHSAKTAREGTCQALGVCIANVPIRGNEEGSEERGFAYLLEFKAPKMKPVFLFFLNAEVYRRSGDLQCHLDSLYEKASQLGAELFVLTVYASSERGVNLVFSGGIKEFSEFDVVCLADLPYYYFSEDPSNIRANLRILQKLMEVGCIDRDKGETYVKMLMFGNMQDAVKKLQSIHSKTHDHLVASFTSAGQALGRGVRAWGKKSSKTFFISEELVAKPLRGIVQDLRIEAHLPMLGPVMKGLYEALADYLEKTGPDIRQEQQVNESIETMLEYFAHGCMERYRAGDSRFHDLPEHWKRMRRALLVGDVLHGVPGAYLKSGSRNKQKDIPLIEWAYEECDPGWEDTSPLGKLLKAIQTKKCPLGRSLRGHIRMEGAVAPVEHGGKFYRPREITSRSLIRPAISESLVMEALRVRGVKVEAFHEDRRLFELFDLFLPEANMALDVKYWDLNTIFMADGDEMLKGPERRLKSIREVLGVSATLAYVLFFDMTAENREAPHVLGLDDSIPFKERMREGGIVVTRMLNPCGFDTTREFETFCSWLGEGSVLNFPVALSL